MFISPLHDLKASCRRLQRIWTRIHSAFDPQCFRSALNKYNASIIRAKRTFNSSTISSNLSNPRKLWTAVNKLLHHGPSDDLPSSQHPQSLSDSFANFFSSKIHKLNTNLLLTSADTSPHIPCPHVPPHLNVFHHVSFIELS